MQAAALAAATAVGLSLGLWAQCRWRRAALAIRSADENDMLTFVMRALCDSGCDTKRYGNHVLLYLTSHTDDNVSSVAAGAAMARAALPPGIQTLLLGLENEKLEPPTPCYGGPQVLEELLDREGLSHERLPYELPYANTLTEAETVIRECQRQNAMALVVVAPPFHMPRALLTFLSVCAREMPALHVYAAAGGTAPGWWNAEVVHSQGVVRGVRTDLVQGEVERMRRYCAKGDLLTPREALQLLARRDER
mmetsp:Transcript_1927/g.6200  ORF Transcript_1927/g.6200 Transcript_1927/m.6200 type:complete len:251 (+) Transcript_1927:146-898(+)